MTMELVKTLIRIVSWGVSCAFPRQRNKIVFSAWFGKSYSDSAKYVFQHFFGKDDFRIVWIGKTSVRVGLLPLPRNASYSRMGSLSAYWHLLTAKYWVFTHSCCDFSLLPLYGHAVLMNVGHGSFGTKKMGCRCASWQDRKRNRLLEGLESHLKPSEKFFLVGNRLVMEHHRDAYPGVFDNTVALPFGTATLDFLLANKDNSALKRRLKQRIASDFGLPMDKKWIVYAPTFRWTKDDNFSFHNLTDVNRNRLEKILIRQDAVIVEKLHPNCLSTKVEEGRSSRCVFSIRGQKALQLDQNYLWLIADICISDYSAASYLSYFAGNPVVHFAYDLEFYETQDTGLSYPLEDVKVGPIARTTEELLTLLSAGVKRLDVDKVGKMVPVLFEYEKGKTGAQVEEFLRRRL